MHLPFKYFHYLKDTETYEKRDKVKHSEDFKKAWHFINLVNRYLSYLQPDQTSVRCEQVNW